MSAQVEWHGDKALRQMAFGTAVGLTRTAQAASRHVTQSMPARFDRPTPFTQKAIAIMPARRDRLVARVLIKDLQAAYLLLQETGGTRRPQPGKPVNLPANIRVNAYGNIPRGAYKRLLQRADVFVSDGKSPKTAHLRGGIYQRYKQPKGRTRGGSRKMARPPSLLIAFEREARYQPRFGFVRMTMEEARRVYGDQLRLAVQQAMASAR